MSGWTSWIPDSVALTSERHGLPSLPSTASGLYMIRDAATRRILYVGESHTGRLRKTCIRHYQAWGLDADHTTRRATYRRGDTEIRWRTMRPSQDFSNVEDAEAAAIARYEPRDNVEVPEELAAFFELERLRLRRKTRRAGSAEIYGRARPDDPAPF